jgi:superfamily II DNA or RNA helicase
MLRDLELKAVYRTDEDNILEDFYLPALSSSVSYQRAVGFFSASMLSYAAQGLSAFVENQGTMQLVIGGELDADEVQAIRQGYDTRDLIERFGLQLNEYIDSIADALTYRRLEALSWLVATGRLKIKVALRPRGMYHEKIGILRDANGDAVVFQGSANESVSALLPDFNFESINVFPCWHQELAAHFTPYLRGFNRLWENETKNTWVVDFPEAAEKRLIKIAMKCQFPAPEQEIALAIRSRPQDLDCKDELQPTVPKLLNGATFEMHAHQLAALNAWKARDLQGIFAHSTGSGKTISAIYGATRLFDATKRLAMVIAVPYQNLADQWVSVLAQFQISAIRCYANRESWASRLSEHVDLFSTGSLPFLCVVVVNRTLQSDEFQQSLSRLSGKSLLFIGDECHHHASSGLIDSLPESAAMRLGLSATPEHYCDNRATDRLKGYYGEIASEFSLADALAAGVIAPYEYHVSLVTLNDAESEAYLELSERIGALAAMSTNSHGDLSENEQLKALLMRRARLLGSAEGKCLALKNLLEDHGPQPLSLFYVGDGSTEGEDDSENVRDIDRVSELLYKLGWNCSKFTARESRAERERLLSLFECSALHALVAIRCLDEGIDVPACRTAYLLASSRNPKQFIQRRGRILRKAPGKDHAIIYDFLVRLPATVVHQNPFERRLVATELERVAEFAQSARNCVDATRVLMPVLKEYDLAHALA